MHDADADAILRAIEDAGYTAVDRFIRRSSRAATARNAVATMATTRGRRQA